MSIRTKEQAENRKEAFAIAKNLTCGDNLANLIDIDKKLIPEIEKYLYYFKNNCIDNINRLYEIEQKHNIVKNKWDNLPTLKFNKNNFELKILSKSSRFLSASSSFSSGSPTIIVPAGVH